MHLAAPKWGGSPTLSAKPAFLPFAPQQLAAILGKNLAPPPLNPPSREGIYLHRNYLVMQSPLQFSAWHLEHSCIADTCKTKAASSIRRLPSWLAAVKNKLMFFLIFYWLFIGVLLIFLFIFYLLFVDVLLMFCWFVIDLLLIVYWFFCRCVLSFIDFVLIVC